MRIALYQPDIPQNTGNIFRLGACLGVDIDIRPHNRKAIEDHRLSSIISLVELTDLRA